MTLTAIAAETKINGALLEGLERDDLSRWPGGLFRRAYIRAYAQAIGLNPELVVREFLELHPEPIEEGSPVATIAQMATDAGTGRPRTRLGFLLEGLASFRPPRQVRSTSEDPALRGAPAGLPIGREDDAIPGVATVQVTDRAATRSYRPPVQPKGSRPVKLRKAPVVDPNAAIGRETVAIERNLASLARLCTTLAAAGDQQEVTAVVEEAARMVDARGIILWLWNRGRASLCPVLACGYADEVLTELPNVGRNADNAIAAAFRSAQTRVVTGVGPATGAFVAPLLTPAGCVGVLAFEFGNGGEQREFVRAIAIIVSAQLSTLFAGSPKSTIAEESPIGPNHLVMCVDNSREFSPYGADPRKVSSSSESGELSGEEAAAYAEQVEAPRQRRAAP